MRLRSLLTATSIGLLAVALALMGLGVYGLVTRYLRRTAEHRMRVQVTDAWCRLQGQPSRSERELQEPLNSTRPFPESFLTTTADRDMHLTWSDLRGQLLLSAGGPPHHLAPERLLEVSWMVEVQGQPVGRLTAANGQRPSDDLLKALGRYLLGIGLLLVGAGWWLSQRLAREILQPVETLLATVSKVASGDLTARAESNCSTIELQLLSQSFDAMVEQLQASFAARQQFLADASHELKTPLTSIGALAELLELNLVSDPERAARASSTIVQESVRLNRLVNDLLSLVRAEQSPALPLQPVDLVAVVKGSIQEFQLLHPEQLIELTGEGWALAELDGLDRVLRNLLENALRYSPIDLPVVVEVASGCIRVIDRGSGIAKDDQLRVFERFYRADLSRARKTGGAGLGLSIVKNLVEAMGGRISLESEPGKTTFTVQLQLVQ